MANRKPATKFSLTIELGNDAMRTRSDIAKVLRTLADDLAYGEYTFEGRLKDVNGNTVGKWEVER